MYNTLLKTIDLKPKENTSEILFFNSNHLQPCMGILAELHTERFAVEHKHDFYEVIFCLEGAVLHYYHENYIDGNKINYVTHHIEKDSIVIIPPKCLHKLEYLTTNLKILNFHIEESRFLQLTNAINMATLQKKLINGKIHSSSLNFEDYLYNIYSVASYTQNERATLSYTLLTNLFSSMIQKSITKPNWLTVLLAQLNTPSNYDRALTDIVKDSGYSYSQLSKLFKKEMNQSIIDYFIDSKMKYALALLNNPNLKIIDISYMLGYNNCSFFSKTFKKIFGISPKEYRNKNKTIKTK